MCNGGQLSLKQRLILESLLDEGTKLCVIASQLHRDPRGIAYEIRIPSSALRSQESAKQMWYSG